MSVTKEGFFSSCVLFGGVLFSSWLAIKSTILQDPIKDKNEIVGIGADLKDWQMSDQGRLESVMSAKKMWHYADGRSQFFSVSGKYFDLTRSGVPPWKMSSDIAWVSTDSRYVHLKGHALIQRDKAPSSPAIEGSTTHLTYDRGLNLLYTDALVTVNEPAMGNSTTGVGLNADLNKNEIKLLKDVHTLYRNEKTETDQDLFDQAEKRVEGDGLQVSTGLSS